MRFTLVAALLCAPLCLAADGASTAGRVLEGSKARFPAKAVAEGQNAAVAALESCTHSIWSEKPLDDLRRARASDHVRFLFARPVRVRVMGKDLDVSELVYADGAFWARSGDKVLRCAKYRHEKFRPFQDWYRQPLPEK